MLSMTAFVAGVALAASPPAWQADQQQYAQVLNSLAASVMRWYGDLATPEAQRSGETREGVAQLFQNAGDDAAYRSLYPKHIRNVVILDAALNRRQPGQFEFRLESRLFHGQSAPLRSDFISETFIFSMPTPKALKIVEIVRERSSNETVPTPLPDPGQGDALHYRLRAFAYTWLAHLDGAFGPSPPRLIADVMHQTTYEIEFGDISCHGDVASTLHWRRRQQGTGGHLLRSLTVMHQPDNTDRLTIELVMDWKGTNLDGLSAIGKIRQVIDLKIIDHRHIKVINIRENHLLPDLEPWTRLLC